ncbi:MAG: heavy metal-associated domain-containing protein [Clostridia bacterium]|nr:heavy metal-associated domain-containing protein [Clostridia bacterium]
MTKVYKFEELDCANCAAKMEDAINKMPEVKQATVNFMTQKLTLETESEITVDLLKKIEKTCRKVERDCRLIY